ncbi:T9SS C-terminal target domain-containing protein [candidate division KSB1 bacterium]|nr:MAG: T9SS C-terminal target domain-containing protein [candidate division KSB1 bacterium]
MKKSILVFMLAAALAVLAFAAGMGQKKNPLFSKSAVQYDSSGIKLKKLIPDFSLPIPMIDPARVEPLSDEHILRGSTPSPLKQKRTDLEARIRAGLARGEDVSTLRAEMDELLKQFNSATPSTRGPVAQQRKREDKQQGWTADPFQTAATRGEAVMPPAETDPQLLQVRELEREAEDMLLAGQDISEIKARLNVLYERILPHEPKATEKSASFNERFSRMQDDHTPPSPLLYYVSDAPASAPNAVKRFWEPGDPVGMQIEELNRQAAEIERKGGDVAEIKARMNALYEMLPAYRGKMSSSTERNLSPDMERSFFTRNSPKQMIVYDGKIIEVEPGVTRTELPAPQPERTRTGTLDENGGTIFEFASNNPIPDNSWISFGKTVDMGSLDTILVDIEVTIDTLFHEYDGDLEISLISPQGDTCILSNRNGGLYDNYIETVFDDEATPSITAGSAPFTGSFRPEEPLSQFDGINPNGTWWLLVRDLALGDVGVMRRWHLQVRANREGDDCNYPYSWGGLPNAWINTCDFHEDYDYACPYPSSAKDVVFRYDSPITQQVYMSLCPSEFDTKLYVYEDACTGTPVACSDDALSCPGSMGSFRSYIPALTLLAGHTYFVVIDGYGTNCGWACLESAVLPPCDVSCRTQDHVECAEIQDTLLMRDDCDGGPCNSVSWYPGPPQYESLQNGQTACGKIFSVNWHHGSGGMNIYYSLADRDWYHFTLDQASTVQATATCEYPFSLAIVGADTCAALSYTDLIDQSSFSCSTLTIQAPCLTPGTYSACICPTWLGSFPTIPRDYRLTVNWTPCIPGQGCATAFEFTDDTVFVGHTTCGLVDEYNHTCLGDYDGGEDVVYKWHVTEAGDYTVWLNPYSSSWTGIVLDSVCPPRTSGCIAVNTQALNAPHGIVGQHLAPGTYYIMVDTYPAPDCIPRYDLSVGQFYDCVACLPTDSVECAETTDSLHAYHDCNGGCFNLDEIERFQSIRKHDTLCGSVFTYVRGDSVFSDMDWYRFSLAEFDTLGFLVNSEFDYNIRVGRLINGCDSIFWQASGSAWGSQCIPSGTGWCCAAPGEWVLTVRSLNIAPVTQDYRLVVIAAPALNGLSCYIPQMVTDEDTLTNQTTCGFSNDYGSTCLNSYDSGEDKVYHWTVTQEGDYTIWMDPGATEWTGIVLDDNCPPDTTACIATSTAIGAEPHGILCQHLTPGDYTIMVDTWPLPDCIPDYRLYLKQCCVSCQPGDVAECAEHQTINNLSQDCDGGCNHQFGGTDQFGSIFCGQTVCGRGFTYPIISGGWRDTDWHLFTVAQRESISVTCTADFPFLLYLLDTLNACTSPTILHDVSGNTCETASFGRCISPGTYALWVGASWATIVDIPGEYRLTMNCYPCSVPGENCDVPIPISDDTTLTSLTTCGTGNDYTSTCAYYDDGEDIIFRWTVTQEGMYTVWLDPHETMGTDIVVDDHCPPDTGDCIAQHDSWSEIQHGVCVSLPAGVYYIMVGSTSMHGCISEFDLSISHSGVPANDLCENAISLTIPSTVYGSTKCATVDAAPACWEDPPFYPGVWYTVAGTGHTITANICSSAVQWDNRMSVYACGCDRLHSVACESDLCDPSAHLRPVSWCSRAGETYWILVHGLWGASGDFRLDLTDGGIPCAEPVGCPCWDTVLTAPGEYSGSTIGAGDDCGLFHSPDIVVKVLIPSAGNWRFTLCNSTDLSYDPYLFLGTNCCLYDVGHDDDSPCLYGITLWPSRCVNLPVAGAYFATIESLLDTSAGNFVLTVEQTTDAAPVAPAGATASVDRCDSLVVGWQTVPDAQAYRVLLDSMYMMWPINAPETTFVVPRFIPGDSHWVQVAAANNCGWSPYSNPVYGIIRPAPAQVTGVLATDTVCGRTEVYWTDMADETGYRVYRNGMQIGADLPANTVIFFDSTGLPDIICTYSVAAFNLYCEGLPSLPDSGIRRIEPASVTGITATDSLCDRIEVSWMDVTDETGYRVLRNGMQIGGDLPSNTVYYCDTTAVAGVACGYSIVSFNAYCSSLPGAVDSGLRLAAPDQVAGVIASDTSCDNVHVTWTDIADETGYQVYRDHAPIGLLQPANTISFVDTTAIPGVRYAYQVRAEIDLCIGPESSVDSGIRIITPSRVSACNATDTRCDSIIVTWTDVTDETGYRVFRSGLNISGDLPIGTTRYADGHAGINVSYEYSVVAFHLNCMAQSSQTDQGIRLAGLPAVEGVTASDTLCEGVRVCWDPPNGADSIQIQRDSVRIGAVTPSETCFLDSLAAPWISYQYRVLAFNACGASSAAHDQGMCRVPPDQSPQPFFPDTCAADTLCWTDVADEEGYHIYRNSILIGSVAANRTCMAMTTPFGVPVCYAVQAYNTCGTGPMSLPICITLPRTPPQVTIWRTDSCTLSFCWTDVPNETHYVILRNGNAVDSIMASSTCYTDLTPSPGTYVMQVCAANACGCGPLSNPLRIVLPYEPQIASCDATDFLCTGVRLAWLLTPGIPADSFEIQRDGLRLSAAGGMDTSYTDLTAPPFLMHNYTIIPYNICGMGLSCSDSGRMFEEPERVTGVTATVHRCDSVIITWVDIIQEDFYDILRNGAFLGIASQNAQRYADAPPAGFTYYYQVRAHGQCGFGLCSDSANGLRVIAPLSPTAVAASDSLCQMVRVSWSGASGDVDSFYVYRNGAVAAHCPPTDASWDDVSAIQSNLYSVRAFSTECGLAEPVGQDSGTGHSQALTPTNLVFVEPPVCDSVRLTWSAAGGEVSGYVIRRDSVVVDTVSSLHYTDRHMRPGHHYHYDVAGYNVFCGTGEFTGSVAGWSREMLLIGTIPDTVCNDSMCVDADLCSGVDSVTAWLSLNSGLHQRVISWRPDPDTLCVLRQDTLTGDLTADLMFLVFRGVYSDTTHSPNFIWRRLISGLQDQFSEIPDDFFLDQNYPNPFNPKTTIRFGLPHTERVTITVFDITGRRVAILTEGSLSPGMHSVQWDCNACPSGMYIVRMQVADRIFLKKMLLLK